MKNDATCIIYFRGCVFCSSHEKLRKNIKLITSNHEPFCIRYIHHTACTFLKSASVESNRNRFSDRFNPLTPTVVIWHRYHGTALGWFRSYLRWKAHDTRSGNRRHKSTPFSGDGNRRRFSAPIFRSVCVWSENFWRRLKILDIY